MDDIKQVLEQIDDNDIDTMLSLFRIIDDRIKEDEDLREAVKDKLKAFMKLRKWNRYLDKKTLIGITLDIQKREIMDKDKVKELLGEGDFATVTRIITYEKMNVTTRKMRERLKKYVNKQLN